MSPEPFELAFDSRVIRGDRLCGKGGDQVVLIHGAGESDRTRFLALRSLLHRHGIGSTGFDCVGHGETAGTIGESSLASRTRQASAVIDAFGGQGRLAVVGTSMGAYNAIRLLDTQKVDALVLVVPAVYTPEAYDLPFGPQFTAAIRRERSWADSDAWERMGTFTGRLLVLAAEHDSVIPSEIPELLFQSAHRAAWRRLQVIDGASHHRLFSMLSEQPLAFERRMHLLLQCLQAV